MKQQKLGVKLSQNLDVFIKNINCIKEILPFSYSSLMPTFISGLEQINLFVNERGKISKDEEGNDNFSFELEDAKLFELLEKKNQLSSLSIYILPQALFLSLISHYDAFMRHLIKAIYQIKPEILNSSEKKLTFAELIKFDNIEQARSFIVEKEVDTILRKSHVEHFEYLEKKLSISLRKDLKIWSDFVEFTERRNLIAHTAGIVTQQYINVCKNEKVILSEKVKEGKKLSINIEYFTKCYYCLFELGAKLTHTIWRKLLPQDLENADSKLNSIGYDLLVESEYKLSANILKFAYGQKRKFNEVSERLFLINLALSYYLGDNKDLAKKVLSEKDWSAVNKEYKLAFIVIQEDYRKAYSLMKSIGDNGEIIRKASYTTFPLFKNIREKTEFQSCFQEIFNEEFRIEETLISSYEQTMIDNRKKLEEMLESIRKNFDNLDPESKKEYKKLASDLAKN